jgi:hypothetical protein
MPSYVRKVFSVLTVCGCGRRDQSKECVATFVLLLGCRRRVGGPHEQLLQEVRVAGAVTSDGAIADRWLGGIDSGAVEDDGGVQPLRRGPDGSCSGNYSALQHWLLSWQDRREVLLVVSSFAVIALRHRRRSFVVISFIAAVTTYLSPSRFVACLYY